jgi:membrane protein implicated in regulation of membrane protease activity
MKHYSFVLFLATELISLWCIYLIFTNPDHELLKKLALSLLTVFSLNLVLFLIYLFIAYVKERTTQDQSHKLARRDTK